MSEDTVSQANVNIDGKEYEWASLPESIRAELKMVVFINNKLQAIQQDIFAYQTAKNAYIANIKSKIDLGEKSENIKIENKIEDSDSIDFNAFNLS